MSLSEGFSMFVSSKDRAISPGIKMAQKTYVVWSLGPKALIYASLEPTVSGYYQPITCTQPEGTGKMRPK